MRLAVDVMGFENDIGQAIKACDIFCASHNDVEITLVGNKEQISKCLSTNHNYKILHTTQVILMDDNPLTVIRSKTDSSMYKTIELAKLGKVDGALSAGSTNCFIGMAYILLGLIPGVNKPGFLVSIPTTIRNKNTLMIDVGANKTCTSADLYQFALMANIYAKQTLNIADPTIAVLNIGAEKTKGLDYHHQTYDLLEKNKSLNFQGFIEPRNILNGTVDIVVCDGYSGNLTLKSLEAGLKSIASVLKKEFKKPLNWFGALFSLGAVRGIKKTFDYRNNAGAIVCGLNKPLIKTHGDADSLQFLSALECLYKTVKNDVVNTIKGAINDTKNS